MEIQGYNNYLLYPDGRVWSKYRKGRFLKQHIQYKGYVFVVLYNNNNKGKRLFIHRLIAIHYIPNPENKPQVDHINRRNDNRIENLRWATPSENQQNQGMFNNNTSGIQHIRYCEQIKAYQFEKQINDIRIRESDKRKVPLLWYKLFTLLSLSSTIAF